MKTIDNNILKPTKQDQKTALQSYEALISSLNAVKGENPEIEIEETQEKIRIPLSALKLLADILKKMSQGKPISIVPVATEVTTQAAAEMLGCSRPHIVKLLETGKMPFTKVGKHRRIKYEDIISYKKEMKAEQARLISQIMENDERDGLYDL